MTDGAAIAAMRQQTQLSKSIEPFFAVSSRLSGSTNSVVASIVGGAVGFLSAFGFAVAHPLAPLLYTGGPTTLIFGGVALLVARRLGPARDRYFDDRRRLARFEWREDLVTVQGVVADLEHLSEAERAPFLKTLHSTLEAGGGPTGQLRLPAPTETNVGSSAVSGLNRFLPGRG